MSEQVNQPPSPSEVDTIVLPRQRNGRGYAGANAFRLNGNIAPNSVPASRFPARSLREALGL